MLLQSKSAGAFILEPESFLFRFVPRLANRWLDACFVRRYRCHVLDCFIYERKTCVSCAGKHHMRRGVWSPKVRGEKKRKHFRIIRPHQMSFTAEDNSSSPAQREEPRRAPNSMSKTRNLTLFLTIFYQWSFNKRSFYIFGIQLLIRRSSMHEKGIHWNNMQTLKMCIAYLHFYF